MTPVLSQLTSPALSRLSDVLRGMWQGRWTGLIVAWLAALAGATYIFLTPDQYEATARVYVDTQSILKPLMAGLTVQPNVDQQVAILSRTLISRPNVEKLVRMTDMDLSVRTAQQREHLVDKVMRTLYIKSVGRDNLYTIGFRDPQPKQAQRVVQALLSIFVETGLSQKGDDTGRAQRFIDDQIKAYAERLTEAENRVKDFKLKHMDFFDSSGGKDYFGSITALAEDLRKTNLQLQQAIQSRDALKKQLADELAQSKASAESDGASSSIATPYLDARIDALQKNLDALLLRYTDEYPDVVNTRHMIKDLEQKRKETQKRLARQLANQQTPAMGGDGGDPVVQQLKLALADAEAQIAGIGTRAADYQKRYEQLREKAAAVPVLDAEYARLNRNYGIEKQNYEALVRRRESALMSGQLERATGLASFRVIDPPRVAPKPVSPNRSALVPLALLASLCAGFAASYLYSLIRPTFFDSRHLRAIANRPVLGTVSALRNARTRIQRRRQAALFFGGLGGLAITYSIALAFVFLQGLPPF